MVDISQARADAKNAISNNDEIAFREVTEGVMLTSPSYRAGLEGNGKFLGTESAINRQEIADIRETTHDEYTELLDKSRQAQEIWTKIPVNTRAKFLEVLSQKLSIRQEQIAFAISANVGKGFGDSIVEYGKAAEWTKWALESSTQKQLDVEFVRDEEGEIAKVKKPAGVVGVVTSFNYPLALSIAGIIPAMLSGNSVIFKNASIAPYWSYFFQDAFQEAMGEFLEKESITADHSHRHWINAAGMGDSDFKLLQKNLFSIINGRDNNMILDVDNLFFVGGTATGKAFEAKRQAQAEITGRNLTTHLELGGNSAAIVLQSAFEGYDGIDTRAEEIAQIIFAGAIGNSGQRCTAARLLVRDESAEAEQVFQKLQIKFAESVRVGNPFDEVNTYGALVDKTVYQKLQNFEELYEKLAQEDVLVKKFGGGIVGENYAPKGGHYVYPTMYDWTNVSDEVLQRKVDLGEGVKTLQEYLSHETFGPLLHVLRKAQDKEHALDIVNEYDKEQLAAGVFANDAEFEYFERNLAVTSVKKDSAPKDQSPVKPHGNWSHKFHTGGKHAFDSYIRLKEIKVETREHKDQIQTEHGLVLGRAA